MLSCVALFAIDIRPPSYSGSVKFIKQEILNYKFKGFSFSEISDLAYDKKRKLLYMISDKGSMFTFKAEFSSNNFKLTPLSATYFKRKNGKRLRKWKRDTEGIALDSRGKIFISREGKPRVTLFNKNGVKIRNLKIPRSLKRVKLRSNNKSLESLAYHSEYGLLTALEFPPKGINMHKQTIYSLSGKRWSFKTEPYKNSGVSEIEVTDDGNLLVLERAYNGYFGKFVVTLKKVYTKKCKGRFCPTKKILIIDRAKGWRIDNFEGLAKVGKNRYLIISDDNNNFFQSTILLYIEIKD